jgi:hypothetical protein
MALTRDPGLGITIASTAPDNVHNIVGQIAGVCSSMRDALRMFERYRALLGNANRFELVEEGERAYLVFAPFYPDPEIPEFDAELALSLMYRVSRRYAKRDSDDAQEIWFTHAAPAYLGRYAEVFRCPVRFSPPCSTCCAMAPSACSPSKAPRAWSSACVRCCVTSSTCGAWTRSVSPGC